MGEGLVQGGRDSGWLGSARGPCVGPRKANSLGLYLGPGRGSRGAALLRGSAQGSLSFEPSIALYGLGIGEGCGRESMCLGCMYGTKDLGLQLRGRKPFESGIATMRGGRGGDLEK